MSGKSDLDTDLRKKILARPNVILDDKDLMRALVGAKEEAMGGILSTSAGSRWNDLNIALTVWKIHIAA